MTERKPRKIGLKSALLLAALGLGAVTLSVRRDQVLKPGETIQYDDFFFTLRGVNRSLAPDGAVEYVVKLTVENRAARVPFRVSEDTAALVDANSGKRYHVDPVAQRAYDAATGRKQAGPLMLEAGKSATMDYVFRLPAAVTDPRLRIAPGGWSGMIIESILFGVKEFQLP